MKKIIFCQIFVIILLVGLFLVFGCSSKKTPEHFQQKVLNWVDNETENILGQLPEKIKNDPNLKNKFYILDSFNYKNGYCIEIASRERQPAKYKETLADPTTLPFFVNINGEIELENLACFSRIYEKNKVDLLEVTKVKIITFNNYSIFHFLLTREVGNILQKQFLKSKDYQPNYVFNSAAEFFNDVFILDRLKNPAFKRTLNTYLNTKFFLNEELLYKDYYNKEKRNEVQISELLRIFTHISKYDETEEQILSRIENKLS